MVNSQGHTYQENTWWDKLDNQLVGKLVFIIHIHPRILERTSEQPEEPT